MLHKINGIQQMTRQDTVESASESSRTLGHLLALHVTPANEQDRAQVKHLARAVQKLTGKSVDLAYVDQGYTGETAHQAAQTQGIELEVVKHTDVKRGFVLLPRRWGRRRLGSALPPSGARL